jgi:2-polyprenyl-3-methyl-5-hydroxy-6-metoxy-1,4-benzoquinol methylase
MAPVLEEGTCQRLFARYHTFTRRPDPRQAQHRKAIFETFRRVLGPWLPQSKEARILDVGCGEGWLLLFLREAGYSRLSGFDLSAENVSICHQLGLNFVRRFNLTQLADFEKETLYDCILVVDVLEHIPKNSAAGFLFQARGRLARGGVLLVQTPNMGSVFGLFHRYNDLSHEFGLTEKSARDLFAVAGFAPNGVDIRPAWNAATALGRFREVYLRLLHALIFLAEDSSRPRIPTKNLLVIARA